MRDRIQSVIEASDARVAAIQRSAEEEAKTIQEGAAAAAGNALARIGAVEGRLGELVAALRTETEALTAGEPVPSAGTGGQLLSGPAETAGVEAPPAGRPEAGAGTTAPVEDEEEVEATPTETWTPPEVEPPAAEAALREAPVDATGVAGSEPAVDAGEEAGVSEQATRRYGIPGGEPGQAASAQDAPDDEADQATRAREVPDDDLSQATRARQVPDEDLSQATRAREVPDDDLAQATRAREVPDEDAGQATRPHEVPSIGADASDAATEAEEPSAGRTVQTPIPAPPGGPDESAVDSEADADRGDPDGGDQDAEPADEGKPAEKKKRGLFARIRSRRQEEEEL